MNAAEILTTIIVALILILPIALIIWLVRFFRGRARKKQQQTLEQSTIKNTSQHQLQEEIKKEIKRKILKNILQNIKERAENQKNAEAFKASKLRIIEFERFSTWSEKELLDMEIDPYCYMISHSEDKSLEIVYFGKDRKEIIYRRKFDGYEIGCERLNDYLLINIGGKATYFIDMKAGKDIFAVEPEFSWQNIVAYENGILTIHTRYGDFEVNQQGKLVDKISYLKAIAVSYSSYSTDAVSQLFKLIKDEDHLQFYHTVLDEVYLTLQNEFHSLEYLSSSLKLKGEIYEYQQDWYNAYRVYALGLQLNPKLTVKRAIKNVAKQLRENTIESINKSAKLFADPIIAKNEQIRKEAAEKSRLEWERVVKLNQGIIK